MSPPPRGVRRAVAFLAVGASAALGALILGEYDLSGATPYLAGVLFGLVTAEIGLAVARAPARGLAPFAGLAAAGGMVWAGWISTGHWRAPVPAAAWIGAVLAGVVGAGWSSSAGRSGRRATGRGNQP